MLDLRVASRISKTASVVAVMIAAPEAAGGVEPAESVERASDDAAKPEARLLGEPPPGVDPAELAAFLDQVEHSGRAGLVHTWTRPLQPISRLRVVGVGAGDEAGWRSAGAALARAAKRDETLTLVLPANVDPARLRGLAEGLWLASYRFWRDTDGDEDAPKLRRVSLVRADGSDTEPDGLADALQTARVTARMTILARDLTNTPSNRKTPAWLARRVMSEARGTDHLSVTVREPAQLAAEGFGGLLAVGAGSDHGPRLVELAWRPPGARVHVVLVGKGITFDTGGVCIKPRDGMKLMRKDMGGAAAVAGATLGAAALRLRLRVTALLPLAENMLSGTAMRPGDVVRHYGGTTCEVRNTDAEGRLVLADGLAYAAHRLRPDLLVDVATLTGAQSVALGKRTAALFSEDDVLAGDLADAAAEAGEQVWRLPLPEDYRDALDGDDTDLINSTEIGAGCILAALFLREFTGTSRGRWAHVDMSAPAWADNADAELVKGATGWGVRTLLRWLSTLAERPAD